MNKEIKKGDKLIIKFGFSLHKCKVLLVSDRYIFFKMSLLTFPYPYWIFGMKSLDEIGDFNERIIN